MANSEMTKRALADAFCTLAQKMPADKITVGARDGELAG